MEYCSAMDSGKNFSDHLPLELHIIGYTSECPDVKNYK